MAQQQMIHSGNVSRRFVLQWFLDDPFLPYEIKNLELIHLYPTRTLWEVSIEARKARYVDEAAGRQWHAWELLFCIECDWGPVEAESLMLSITANGDVVISCEGSYVFDDTNDRSFEREGKIKHGKCSLEINVKIEFPETSPSEISRRLRLSRDLGRLLVSEQYCDLELAPANEDEENFPVHSCILRARWTNFFRIHPEAEIVDRTVKTGISSLVLADLLTYLYTGSDKVVRGIASNPLEYKEELFSVIKKYELQHLGEEFGIHGYSLGWRTICVVRESKRRFNLPLLTPERWWDQPMPGVTVDFQLAKTPFENNFEYWLRFECEEDLDARVIVEFLQSPIEGRDRVVVVHGKDFEIDEGGDIAEDSFPLEGYCEELDNFLEGTVLLGQSFRFLLYLTDGEKSDDGRVMHGDWDLLKSRERRLQLLRDHLRAALPERDHADLRLIFPEARGDLECFLHKAIFAARVPNWRNQLQYPGGDPIPDDVSEIPNAVRVRPGDLFAEEVFRDSDQLLRGFWGVLIDG